MFTQNRRRKKFIFIELGFSITPRAAPIARRTFMHNTGRIVFRAHIHA
ncbi:hypothetical protein [Caballeronia concitans]|nr:hypothetical protein [Caballeronia concitans]